LGGRGRGVDSLFRYFRRSFDEVEVRVFGMAFQLMSSKHRFRVGVGLALVRPGWPRQLGRRRGERRGRRGGGSVVSI
jgi:hypothetical protein